MKAMTSCVRRNAILVRYYNANPTVTLSCASDMPVCNDANAANIFNCIASSMHDKGLEWSNCVGFSSDNCNVMIGKNNSVLTRVKAQAPYT